MRPPRKHTNGSGGPASGAIKCAIYTRKSTDEGLDRDFNSLDAQREAAEAYVASQAGNGWLLAPDRYDDGGFSGGNLERPALRRLLADIEAGGVQRVVVYKIDRLTRSLMDFAELARTFEQHGVGIVSVTQQFDTATSYGRLTLNMLLSFAQFEREMVSDRTRDKLRAARRKGKFVGGGLILGYDLAPGGGGIVVNAPEAERVSAVFQLFLEVGSILGTVEELNRRGWTLKRWTTKQGRGYGGGKFDVHNLRRMLTNPAYIAEVHFDGTVVAAEHEAILDRETWDPVQAALVAEGGKPQRRSSKNPSLLAGILRCSPCDAAMTPTYSQRGIRRYRYYLCLKAHRQGRASCPSKQVPATQIEKFVVDKIRSIGRDPELVAATVEASRQGLTARRQELEADVRRLQEDLDDAHASMRKAMIGVSRSALGQARIPTREEHADVQRLEEALAAAHRELDALRGRRIDPGDLRAALAAFDPVWDHLTSPERAKVVQLLIEQVSYHGGSGSLRITFAPVGVRTLAAEAGR